MLKAAQLYEDKLKEEMIRQWYQPENIYFDGGTGDSFTELPEGNYESHCFVSVDKEDNLLGYIAYSVDWAAMSAYSFGAISFKKGSIIFAKDVWKAVCDIFEVYHMNRLSWWCFADNPAIRSYRRFIKNHGGVECGYRREAARLQDGKLHDEVEFEVLAREFHKGRENRNPQNFPENKKDHFGLEEVSLEIGGKKYSATMEKCTLTTFPSEVKRMLRKYYITGGVDEYLAMIWGENPVLEVRCNQEYRSKCYLGDPSNGTLIEVEPGE